MIDQRRLSLHDLVIGEPLPWDVYGAGNKLLLRRGQVLDSKRQAEELADRGLFIDVSQDDRARQARKEASAPIELPSAVHEINLAAKRLERLLVNLANESDAPAQVLELGQSVARAIDINPDVALACIPLNRGGAGYSVRHALDTATLTLLVARSMRKSPAECQSMVAAALTMNVAMLRQQERLQDKQEPLADTEREAIEAHPRQATELLSQAGVADALWLDCVRLHHEDPDGSGYPLGPEAPAIPETARIVALADRYCAAVAPRRYRRSLLPAAALRDVFMKNGTAAEPVLAAHFIKQLGTAPPGTLVRLQDGEIGVITQRSGPSGAPVVHAFIGPRGSPLSFPIKRDAGKPLHAIREVLPAELAPLRFSMQQLWGVEAAS